MPVSVKCCASMPACSVMAEPEARLSEPPAGSAALRTIAAVVDSEPSVSAPPLPDPVKGAVATLAPTPSDSVCAAAVDEPETGAALESTY